MKLKKTTLFVTAAFAGFFMASSAYAECKLSGEASGVIQDKDLVRFNTNLNGVNAQYARTFDDTSKAGKAMTVESSSNCEAIVYHGSGAHERSRTG